MRDISQRFQLLGMHERTNRRTSIMKSFGWLCDAKNMLILCSKYAKLEIVGLQSYKIFTEHIRKKLFDIQIAARTNRKKIYQKHKKLVRNPNTAQQKLQNPVIHKHLSQKHMGNVQQQGHFFIQSLSEAIKQNYPEIPIYFFIAGWFKKKV